MVVAGSNPASSKNIWTRGHGNVAQKLSPPLVAILITPKAYASWSNAEGVR